MYSSRQTRAKYMNYILQNLISMQSGKSQKQDAQSTSYSQSYSPKNRNSRSQPGSQLQNYNSTQINFHHKQNQQELEKVVEGISQFPRLQENKIPTQLIKIEEMTFKYNKKKRINKYQNVISQIHAQTFSLQQKQKNKAKQFSQTMNIENKSFHKEHPIKPLQIKPQHKKKLELDLNSQITRICQSGHNSPSLSEESIKQILNSKNELNQHFMVINKQKNYLEEAALSIQTSKIIEESTEKCLKVEDDYIEIQNNQEIILTFFNQRRQFIRIKIKNERFPLKFSVHSKIGQIYLFFDYKYFKPDEEKHDYNFTIKGNISYQIPWSSKIRKNADYVYIGTFSEQNCQASIKVWFEDQHLIKYRLKLQMQEEKFKKMQLELKKELKSSRQKEFDEQEKLHYLSFDERINRIEKKRQKRQQSSTKGQKNFTRQNALSITNYRERTNSQRALQSSREQQKSEQALSRKNMNVLTRLHQNYRHLIKKEVDQFYLSELRCINYLRMKIQPFQKCWIVILKIVLLMESVQYSKKTFRVMQMFKKNKKLYSEKIMNAYNKNIKKNGENLDERQKINTCFSLRLFSFMMKIKAKKDSGKIIISFLVLNVQALYFREMSRLAQKTLTNGNLINYNFKIIKIQLHYRRQLQLQLKAVNLILNSVINDLKIEEGIDQIIFDYRLIEMNKRCHYLQFLTHDLKQQLIIKYLRQIKLKYSKKIKLYLKNLNLNNLANLTNLETTQKVSKQLLRDLQQQIKQTKVFESPKIETSNMRSNKQKNKIILEQTYQSHQPQQQKIQHLQHKKVTRKPGVSSGIYSRKELMREMLIVKLDELKKLYVNNKFE